MKRTLVVCAFLMGLLPMARSQAVAVSAELSLEHNTLLPDEKMYLKLTVVNRAGQDLQLGTVSNWLTFTVTGEKNMVAPQLRDDCDYCAGVTNVPTGSFATREFNLTPYFDFRQPGNYTVKATIKIPQWQEEVIVKPVAFTIVNGIRLANIPYTDLPVGDVFLHSGTNQAHEVRKFYLERSDERGNMNLFVRLTDGTGNRTTRLVLIGPYVSYTAPDTMMDRYNNFHVLHQTGAQLFTYCVLDTLGQILERQTYQYTDQRPVLRGDDKGGVVVTGGVRVVTTTDLPPPQIEAPSATATGNTNMPGGRR